MDREVLFVALVLTVAGPLFWLGGLVPFRARLRRSGCASEAAHWRALWLPAVAPLIALATLAGWAVLEPENAEPIGFMGLVSSTGSLLVWVRAALRAVRSVAPRATGGPAATVGLLRPRVILDPAFVAQLDEHELRAVRAHEEAHRRHGDPARLLAAQLVTDLQWPMPFAQRRLREWRLALELARDEEARLAGGDGAALASAILRCARRRGRRTSLAVGLLDCGDALAVRVRRLLDAPVHTATSRRSSRLLVLALGMTTIAAFVAGLVAGEPLVRLLLAECG